jgi:hypothetical protein
LSTMLSWFFQVGPSCSKKATMRTMRAAAAALLLAVDGAQGLCCNSSFEIVDGVYLPWISNGAVGFPKHDQEQAAIELWLSDKVGGRGVDTAWCYRNQEQVGYAVGNATEHGADRAEIFITTKVRR